MLEELHGLLLQPKRFVSLLIAGVAAFLAIVTSLSAASVALSTSIQTAQFVENLACNTFLALHNQENIDQKLFDHVQVLEQVVLGLGDQIQLIKEQQKLCCHGGIRLSVLPPPALTIHFQIGIGTELRQRY